MKITCTHCQNQMQLDDAKVPSGVFKIKCTKCGKIVSAQKGQSPDPGPATNENDSLETLESDIEAFVEEELSQFKKDILGSLQTLLGIDPSFLSSSEESSWKSDSSRSALLCVSDSRMVDTINHAVRRMGYSVDLTSTAADAIKKIDDGFYTLIIVDQSLQDDKESGSKVVAKINSQKPVQRRQTFVVLISPSLKTADANAAFLNGANVIANKEDVGKLDSIIRDGQHHFQQIYAAFNRVVADKEQRA